MSVAIAKGDRSLFYSSHICSNGPTIIFESGLGNGLDVWEQTISRLDNRYSYLCYDRAGLGKSDLSSAEQSVDSAFSDLQLLIEASKVQPPFILVGHSYGGVLIQHFAEELGKQCCGLVLVDASDQDFRDSVFNYRNDQEAKYWEELNNQKAQEEAKGINRELNAFDHILMSSKGLSNFRSLPIYSLVCDNIRNVDKTVKTSPFDSKLASYELMLKDNANWISSHEAWASGNENTTVAVAENCTHYIHTEKPEMVVKAIDWVFKQL